MEKALVWTLTFSIAFLMIFRKFRSKEDSRARSALLIAYSIDMIPSTQQGNLPRPPNLPEVPIPSDDEFMIEDETIDETFLDIEQAIPLFDGQGPYGLGGADGLMPRPIHEVIPEYPESEKRRGIGGTVELDILVNAKGAVDSVVVFRNATMSDRLAIEAVSAAYRSLYEPAKRDGKNVSRWIRRPYRFGKD